MSSCSCVGIFFNERSEIFVYTNVRLTAQLRYMAKISTFGMSFKRLRKII